MTTSFVCSYAPGVSFNSEALMQFDQRIILIKHSVGGAFYVQFACHPQQAVISFGHWFGGPIHAVFVYSSKQSDADSFDNLLTDSIAWINALYHKS